MTEVDGEREGEGEEGAGENNQTHFPSPVTLLCRVREFNRAQVTYART